MCKKFIDVPVDMIYLRKKRTRNMSFFLVIYRDCNTALYILLKKKEKNDKKKEKIFYKKND